MNEWINREFKHKFGQATKVLKRGDAKNKAECGWKIFDKAAKFGLKNQPIDFHDYINQTKTLISYLSDKYGVRRLLGSFGQLWISW